MKSFYNWLRVLATLNSFSNRLAAMEKRMATLQEDVTRMKADLATQATLIGQIAQKEAQDATIIADLKAQVAALQGQTNPDLTGLEEGLAALESNNTLMAPLIAASAPPPAPEPPAEPTT